MGDYMTYTCSYVKMFQPLLLIMPSNSYWRMLINLLPPTSITWLKDVTLVHGTQWGMIQTANSRNTSSSLPTWVRLMGHLWVHVPWPCSLGPLLKLVCTHPTTMQRAWTCTTWAIDLLSTTFQVWDLLVWDHPTCGLVWIIRKDQTGCTCKIQAWCAILPTVACPRLLGINRGQKLLDTPILPPMLSIRCLQQSARSCPCLHVPLFHTQTPMAELSWLPCWKAQRCWPYSSCQPPLDLLLVPLISAWATCSSRGPRQGLAATQLTPLSSLPLPLRFSCCILQETMGQTTSLHNRQTCSPKVELTFSYGALQQLFI